MSEHKHWRIEWIDTDNASLLENIAEGVFDEPIRQDRLATYLSNPVNWMVLAISNDLVVGQCMCVLHHHPDKQTELFLDEIGTGAAWRRNGIARCLMEAVCDRARKEGIDEIWLATEPDNVPARGLYESTGAKGEDAIIYYLDW